MLFNSITFIVFFIAVVALHYLPFPWRVKKLNLLLASYLFYAAWNPPFVVLLWISTLVDWYAAKWIGASQDSLIRKIPLVISLCVNLGLLSFFKYGNFVLDNFIALMGALGIVYQPPSLNIILPVGISFYTFQSLSYTLDIYLGRAKAWKSFGDFALYVTFFPQLVAGPIVRAVHFLPQLLTPRLASGKEFGWGLNLLLLGLFEKIVVADGLLAPIVEQVYDAPLLDPVSVWVGTLAFAGQIFLDFAGYSTCAIGVAMCLGFALPNNFRFPYAAIGFTDFWSRWHISLSTWLRDYLYIPLGGNRVSVPRSYVNLMLTMLIGGLWHGAAWRFVIWGGLHGLYLAVERVLRGRELAQWAIWRMLAGRLFLAAVTFTFICFTWPFFRAGSLTQAMQMGKAMLLVDFQTLSPGIGMLEAFMVFVIITVLLFIHWVMRDTTLEEIADRIPSFVWVAVAAGMVISIVIMSPGEDRAFIYFQF